VAQNYLDLSGQRVVTIDLLIPYQGAAIADIDLALPPPNGFAGQYTLSIGNLAVMMTPLRGGAFAGESKVRLVGGFAGWQKSVPAQGYQNPAGLQASMILQDTAAACGEQVSVLADQTLGQFWNVEGSPAQAAKVLRLLAPLWWVDPSSGVTQCYCSPGSTREATAISSDFEAIDWNPGKGLFDITTEDPVSWQPGNTFTNVFLSVTSTISATRIKCSGDGDMHLRVLSTP
jgi:hypothetical protein